jgi:hypothetical protein
MKTKDDLLLEHLYQEGILDRLKGQYSGIKAGAKQGLQNIGKSLYQKMGGEGTDKPSPSAGQSYAKAQQSSLLQSFIKKTNKEIEDFKSDLLSMGVSGDPKEIIKTHPIIAQKIQQTEKLLKFLQDPSNPLPEPPPLPTEEPKAEEPKAEEPKTEEPKAEEPKAEEPKAEEETPENTEVISYKRKKYQKINGNWYRKILRSKKKGTFTNTKVSSKIFSELEDYIKTQEEEEPRVSGSMVQQKRATEAGFSSVAARNAARYQESSNAYADFLNLIQEESKPGLPPEIQSKIDAFLNSEEGKKMISSINKASKDINKSAQENPEKALQTNESYINEAFPSRLISQATGWKRAIQGPKIGEEKLDVQTHQVNKRFEILQKKLGSHLKELQRDLETTSGADTSVKNEVSKMIERLSTEHQIKPTESKLGDLRHKIGRGVEWTGKAAVLGAAGALLGSAVSSLAGIGGLTSLAIKGAVAAATRKVAADLISGKKPNAKQVLVQSLIGAGAGAAFGVAAPLLAQYNNEIANYIVGKTEVDALPGDGIPDSEFIKKDIPSFDNSNDASSSTPTSTEVPTEIPLKQIENSIKNDWPKLSKTTFGRMGIEPTPSNASTGDNAVLKAITQELKNKNLDWTKLSLKQKAEIFNKFTD